MSRIEPGLFLATCLLFAVVSANETRAQETLAWTEKASEGFIALSYGPLDANAQPVFQLSCFNEMEIAVLTVFGAIEGTRPGEKLAIELSAGNAKAEIAAEAALDDKTGTMFAEASDIAVKPVLEVLKSPGAVTVKIAATSRALSDVGRTSAAEKFGKDCTLE